MRWVKRIGVFFVAVIGIAIIAAVLFYLYLRQSVSGYSGEAKLAGLSAPVEIVRDKHAIPHIFASTWNDAYFALGYAQAQDRLWQMEMNRRIAAGRISEVVGERALEVDKLFRTVGFRRVAQSNFESLDSETKSALRSYSAGVNAYLKERKGPLPPEFVIFGVEPEPWEPADSIAWGKIMQWDLSGNWRNELLRMRLSQRLTPQQIAEFLSPYPGDPFEVVPDLKKIYAELSPAAAKLTAMLPQQPEHAVGSNNWVVAGSRTASGKPLLANDPHLGLTAPAIWYFAHLSVKGENAIGATLPGVPWIVIGRNDRIAWGVTNTGPDTQDLFVEKLEAGKPQRYLAPEGYREFVVRKEIVRVKGGKDVELNVRESRHGPVISDVVAAAGKVAPQGHVLAFQWTALSAEDKLTQATRRVQHVRNWVEFRSALVDFHSPQQNFVFADIDGNTGYIAPAQVPKRSVENPFRGLAPAPGWDAKYDWQGTIPFDELPQKFNPPEGLIATANEKIIPPGYPHQLSLEWAPPFRGDRIRALAEATPKHSMESFRAIQGDNTSLAARKLLPLFVKTKPVKPELQAMHERMAKWDGNLDTGRAEPLIFWAWWRELTRLVYADELGPEIFRDVWDARAVFMSNVLSASPGADGTPQSRWCDDVTTQALETCEQQIERALELALADLKQRYGAESNWKWGDAHVAISDHRPFGGVPLLERFVNVRVSTGGDGYTVNAGANRIGNAATPYANRHAASLRVIYDLADLDRSQFMHSTGQSGNPLSPHYADFAGPWSRIETVLMTTKRSEIDQGALGTFKLTP
jgi:penicillin amidase